MAYYGVMTTRWTSLVVHQDSTMPRIIEMSMGIIFPTKRRVYAYEGDYELVKEPLLVKIDMAEITLAYFSLAAV